MIPISLRDLPTLNCKPSKLSNEIIGSFVNMPILPNLKISERLEVVKQIMEKTVKKSLLIFVTNFAMDVN